MRRVTVGGRYAYREDANAWGEAMHPVEVAPRHLRSRKMRKKEKR